MFAALFTFILVLNTAIAVSAAWFTFTNRNDPKAVSAGLKVAGIVYLAMVIMLSASHIAA